MPPWLALFIWNLRALSAVSATFASSKLLWTLAWSDDASATWRRNFITQRCCCCCWPIGMAYYFREPLCFNSSVSSLSVRETLELCPHYLSLSFSSRSPRLFNLPLRFPIFRVLSTTFERTPSLEWNPHCTLLIVRKGHVKCSWRVFVEHPTSRTSAECSLR